jgi:sulfide:quinone oxidoreductase
MSTMTRPFIMDETSPHVVIAGGGFAALETMLALRTLLGDRVNLSLVTAEPELIFRPTATAEAFVGAPPLAYDLRAIAADLGATIHVARLESVASSAHYVRLSSGSRIHYDALLLAVGARPVTNIAGALTFRDQRDVPLFRRVLSGIDSGKLRRLVFALPAGHTWTLPVYELALLSRARISARGLHTEVTIVSPEPTPLAVFGEQPSSLVARLLSARDVHFVGDAVPHAVLRDGALQLRSGDEVEADRVVAAPQLRGRRITGVPADWWGFIEVDSDGRVAGLPDVYAAGDITNFPVKQAGLATQHGDLVADAIARQFGVEPPERRSQRLLQARMVGAPEPIYLRAELDQTGRATRAMLARVATENESAQPKVFAHYLTPYLAQHERFAQPAAEARAG